MPASEKNQPLKDYRTKRSADRTPEPFGGVTPVGGAFRFVVQHHAARALHYDFRLELSGVLKSWAVPKGPSPNPADKRLAVRTEDHPLDYANFEGHIPEGNYGAGSVVVWDRGVWQPQGDPEQGLASGKLLFELYGYKLNGKWTLVKIKRGPKDWLLIKERDAYVSEDGTEDYPSDSILSGLTVAELKSGLDPAKSIEQQLEGLGAPRRRPSSAQLKAMLAQSGKPFSKPGWVFEVKYDGYRLVIFKNENRVTLRSRNDNDLSNLFPEVVEAISKLPFGYLVVDGEVVVHDEGGLPSFSMLQKRGHLTRRADIQRACIQHPVTLYAFDLLGFGNYDVRPLPLTERKTLLRKLLPTVGPVRYSEHIENEGEVLYRQVVDMGLEGMIAKNGQSRYRGGRSREWIKIPVQRADDFVVVGYTPPKGSQAGFGALLLGQYVDGELVFVGRVGSGFSAGQLTTIRTQLDEFGPSPAPRLAPDEKSLCWVEPQLVCEVKFKEVTPDGALRAPVFLRLRDDKHPQDCTRQWEIHALPEPNAAPDANNPDKEIHFTNPDKVFWPAEGYTKDDLIEYYRAMTDYLLPYLKDRPVVLTRYPDGIAGKSFYQKDAPDFAPDWIHTETLWSDSAKREIAYFVIDDRDSLLYIANMASIPIHVWSSRIKTIEKPDWCILDLDPKQAPFAHVRRIACAINRLCERIELKHFVKTSGSTGLHILIPLGARYTHEQSRNLGELLARLVVQQLPSVATVVRSPSKREGKVYIDYLQNRQGQTIVAPFSVRPLPGAPVSMPIQWHEINARLSNSRFTIKNARNRMAQIKQDPLRAILETQTDLGDVLARLNEFVGTKK